MLKKQIVAFIDFFYPPFRKFMPELTFRYAACGGANTVLDIFVFFISFNYLFHKQILHLGFIAFEPYTAAFLVSFAVSFPTGFFLMRSIVFTDSPLRGKIQLFRYFLMVLVCIVLNYFFIKLFVEQFHIYPTIAKILTTAIVVTFSYLSQKHFTFKVKQANTE